VWREGECGGGLAAGKACSRRRWAVVDPAWQHVRGQGTKGGPVGVGHGWAVAVGRPKGIATFCFIQTHF
jgi:hypothetical protein